MIKVLSMAVLSFRENVRSKVALSLFLIVSSVAAFLPLALVGDGSEPGVARMILLYPLAATFGILAFASPWIASAAVAGGVRRRTLQLARVKPIRMWQLLLGKWLGVMLLLGSLLAVAFVISWAHIALRGMDKDSAIGVAKELVGPDLPPVEEQVERIMASAEVSENLDPAGRRRLRATLLRRAPNAAITLHGSTTFAFRPRRLPAAGERFWLRAKLISDAPSSASCSLSRPAANGSGEESLAFVVDDFPPQGVNAPLRFDSAPLMDGELRLDISNTSPKDAPAIVLQPRRGIVLLLAAGSLPANMARAYLVLLSVLALLSAFGVALGAVFSLPVAVFAAICAVVSAVSSDWVVRDGYVFDVEPGEIHGLVHRVEYHASLAVTSAIAFVSRNALDADPLSRLSASEWIPSRDLAKALLSNCVAIPAVLFAVFSVILSRRELPE